MKIKLALLERDSSYLDRIVSVFSLRYTDKLEVYSFTDPEVALKTLQEAKIDVLLASDYFEIDVARIPKRCGFAYFVDSADIDSLNNQHTICRFQKADLIYRQILGIYSEKAGSITGLKLGEDSCKVIAFASPCGGVGSSTMAAACALHFAAQGKKTLYLNLETFGSSDAFFSGAGQYGMSEVIYALKSKKANLGMKLESCVRQDPRGVYFFAQPDIALHMLELKSDEAAELVLQLQQSGTYDYLILDMEFAIDEAHLALYRKAHALVLVSNGSAIANAKLLRALQAIGIKEQSSDSPLTNRISLVYNNFSSQTGRQLEKSELRVLGGAPRYQNAATEQILGQLYRLELFDKIVG